MEIYRCFYQIYVGDDGDDGDEDDYDDAVDDVDHDYVHWALLLSLPWNNFNGDIVALFFYQIWYKLNIWICVVLLSSITLRGDPQDPHQEEGHLHQAPDHNTGHNTLSIILLT